MYIKDIRGHDVRIRLLSRLASDFIIFASFLTVQWLSPSILQAFYIYTTSHDHYSRILEKDGINRYLTL